MTDLQWIDAGQDPSLLRLQSELKRLRPPLWRTMILMACAVCAAAVIATTVIWVRDWRADKRTDAFLARIDQDVFVPYDESGMSQALQQLGQIGAGKPNNVCTLLVRVFAHGDIYAWGLQQEVAPLAGSTMYRCIGRYQRELKNRLNDRRRSLDEVLRGKVTLEEFNAHNQQKPATADLGNVLELCRRIRTALAWC